MSKKTKGHIERGEQIYQISEMVAGAFTLEEVLDKLAQAAVQITETRACSIRLLDESTPEMKMRSTFGLSDTYRNKGPVTKEDPVIKAAFEGQVVVLDDIRVDSRVKYPEAAIEEKLISQLTVAMMFRDKPVGVLRLYSNKPSRFDEDDITIAKITANQCAVAITNAKLHRKAVEGARMKEQMKLAAEIQHRMIPREMPTVCGLDMAAIYQPCFEIGGDFYDFIQSGEHTISLGIADVIGKGTPAAMMMSMFRGTLRAYADGGYGRHSLEEVVERLNNVACRECRNGEFITLFLAHLNCQAKTITYCNCGHEPAILIRGDEVIELDKGGLVLGVLEKTDYTVGKVTLEKGDALLFYTDGLIDAMDFSGELWGKERLIESITKCKDCSAKGLVNELLRYRRRFVGLAKQNDDTSLVAVKITE